MRRPPPAFVRRAVVSLGIGVCVLVVFGVVSAVSAVMPSMSGGFEPGAATWVAATALIAVLAPLLRPWFERLGERLAYGRQGNPYALMNGFVERIADAMSVDEVLPQLARTASQALHSPAGEVRLWLADGGEWRQTWPPGAGAVDDRVSVRVHSGSTPIGMLAVAAAEPATEAHRRLLDRLAGPAGLALSNVRLTYELRRRLAEATEQRDQLVHSRERLVQARAEQRRRFAAAVDQAVLQHLDAVDAVVRRPPVPAPADLAEAVTRASAALEALRDISAGVFPPALSERGLVAALDLQLGALPSVTLELDALGEERLGFAVEAGLYFVCRALVDDLRRDGEAVAVRLGRPCAADVAVTVEARGEPAPETELLVRDRVEALGGRVSRRRDGDLLVVTATVPEGSSR